MYADWKEEITLCLYLDDMSVYIENLKISTKCLQELRGFSKFSVYIRSEVWSHTLPPIFRVNLVSARLPFSSVGKRNPPIMQETLV